MEAPHVEIIPLGGSPFGMGGMGSMHSLGDFLKNIHRTGPAAEHRMGPMFPFGNILTPGAHPAHAEKKEDEKNKADEKKTDENKEEPKKDEGKKEENKPKSDDEKNQV